MAKMTTQNPRSFKLLLCSVILLNGIYPLAAKAEPADTRLKPVLADVKLLTAVGAPILAVQEETKVGYSRLTPLQEEALSRKAHEWGRCGGYEALPEQMTLSSTGLQNVFGELARQAAKEHHFAVSSRTFASVEVKPEIEEALAEVSTDRLKESIEFLSAFPSRFNRLTQPNNHVMAFQGRLDQMLKAGKIPFQIDLISHSSTNQKSIRVRLPGKSRASEIIVLGAHLDSINIEWSDTKKAPGADDNASGSSNLFEALRILSTRPQAERTIDFIWYAGEESGLLGSAEIAKSYKAQKADVVAVLQLDMTLYPGAGEFTLGSMTDFTNPWLRGYLETINDLYIKARIVEDTCGYACSDHASWHRQGYPALMPFEATYDGMNHNIHTSRDLIDSHSDFKHSSVFTKIALVMAMDLGNSSLRETP
jgi:leucyl aminopeptidase